jgi:hypothetical protein
MSRARMVQSTNYAKLLSDLEFKGWRVIHGWDESRDHHLVLVPDSPTYKLNRRSDVIPGLRIADQQAHFSGTAKETYLAVMDWAEQRKK